MVAWREALLHGEARRCSTESQSSLMNPVFSHPGGGPGGPRGIAEGGGPGGGPGGFIALSLSSFVAYGRRRELKHKHASRLQKGQEAVAFFRPLWL